MVSQPAVIDSMERRGNDDGKKESPPATGQAGRKRSVRDPSPSGDQRLETPTRRFGSLSYSEVNAGIDGNDRNEIPLAELKQTELEYELQWLRLRRQRFANEAQLLALQRALHDASATSSSTASAYSSGNVWPPGYGAARNDPRWDIQGSRQSMESPYVSSNPVLPPEGGSLGSSMALRRELELRRRMAYGTALPSAGLDSGSTRGAATSRQLNMNQSPTSQLTPDEQASLAAALRREIQERNMLLEATSQPAAAASSRLWEADPTQRLTLPSSLAQLSSRERELLLEREASGREGKGSSVARGAASAAAFPAAEPQHQRQAKASLKSVLPLSLSIGADTEMLSPYQQLVRQSLEFFQLDLEELQRSDSSQVQGLTAGQVGVRCKYCANRPLHWRGRGSFSFPNRLARVYQAAQNVANNHLRTVCPEIPDSVKEELESRHSEVAPMRGGGKKYWEEACRSVGLYEREGAAGVWLLEGRTSL